MPAEIWENEAAERLTLDGTWQIEIGGQVGDVTVPAAWEAQGYPRDVDKAVYRRTFSIPAAWQGRTLRLRFGAVSYHVAVWVNGVYVGEHYGLWTRFELDITQAAQVGTENSIALHITKPSNDINGEYGYRDVLVGFIPYISTTFGGPWQSIELIAHEAQPDVTNPVGTPPMPPDQRDDIPTNQDILHGLYPIRGILHWGWWPDRIAPAPTDAMIREEFRRVRGLGFNLVKLCLFVPTENVFRIADEMGMLLWLELPLWLPRMNAHLSKQVREEYADILAQVAQHPSIVIYSIGCELEAGVDDTLLYDLYDIARARIGNALLIVNSGSSEAYGAAEIGSSDFDDYHFYSDLHFFEPLIKHFRRDWREKPVIFGEFVAYDDYRHPRAYAGDPWWRQVYGVDAGIHRWAYTEQEQRIAALKLPFSHDEHDELYELGQKHSVAMRKHILEATRKYKHIVGYVITCIRDTPINTAGVFDDLGHAKFSAELWQQINSETALVLESGRRRKWRSGDMPYPQDIYSYRGGDMLDLRILVVGNKPDGKRLSAHFTLPDGTSFLQTHQESADDLPITGTMPEVDAPQEWTLHATFGKARNQWHIWLYPHTTWREHIGVYDPSGLLRFGDALPTHDFTSDTILFTTAYTPQVADYVRAGGRAILMQAGQGALPVQQWGFWQESLPLPYPHEVWRRFGTGEGEQALSYRLYHVAPQFAFDTDKLPEALPDAQISPVLRRLHTRLFTVTDYMIEARIGQGVLLATTLNLLGGDGGQATDWHSNVVGDTLVQVMVDSLSAGQQIS